MNTAKPYPLSRTWEAHTTYRECSVVTGTASHAVTMSRTQSGFTATVDGQPVDVLDAARILSGTDPDYRSAGHPARHHRQGPCMRASSDHGQGGAPPRPAVRLRRRRIGRVDPAAYLVRSDRSRSPRGLDAPVSPVSCRPRLRRLDPTGGHRAPTLLSGCFTVSAPRPTAPVLVEVTQQPDTVTLISRLTSGRLTR